MGSLKTVVTLGAASGLTEDNVVNTFAVETPNAASGADHGVIAAAFASLYNATAPGATMELRNYLGPQISRAANACSVDLYDIDGKLGGQPHGSPIFSVPFTLGAGMNQDALPEECALCVTLRGQGWENALVEIPDDADADTGKERPKQRRTGRFFLGPFISSVNGVTNGRSHPSAAMTANVRAAVLELADALVTGAGSYLAVWSKQDSALYRVTHVETDDAWDTQRRRGRAPTVRNRVAV